MIVGDGRKAVSPTLAILLLASFLFILSQTSVGAAAAAAASARRRFRSEKNFLNSPKASQASPDVFFDPETGTFKKSSSGIADLNLDAPLAPSVADERRRKETWISSRKERLRNSFTSKVEGNPDAQERFAGVLQTEISPKSKKRKGNAVIRKVVKKGRGFVASAGRGTVVKMKRPRSQDVSFDSIAPGVNSEEVEYRNAPGPNIHYRDEGISAEDTDYKHYTEPEDVILPSSSNNYLRRHNSKFEVKRKKKLKLKHKPMYDYVIGGRSSEEEAEGEEEEEDTIEAAASGGNSAYGSGSFNGFLNHITGYGSSGNEVEYTSPPVSYDFTIGGKSSEEAATDSPFYVTASRRPPRFGSGERPMTPTPPSYVRNREVTPVAYFAKRIKPSRRSSTKAPFTFPTTTTTTTKTTTTRTTTTTTPTTTQRTTTRSSFYPTRAHLPSKKSTTGFFPKFTRKSKTKKVTTKSLLAKKKLWKPSTDRESIREQFHQEFEEEVGAYDASRNEIAKSYPKSETAKFPHFPSKAELRNPDGKAIKRKHPPPPPPIKEIRPSPLSPFGRPKTPRFDDSSAEQKPILESLPSLAQNQFLPFENAKLRKSVSAAKSDPRRGQQGSRRDRRLDLPKSPKGRQETTTSATELKTQEASFEWGKISPQESKPKSTGSGAGFGSQSKFLERGRTATTPRANFLNFDSFRVDEDDEIAEPNEIKVGSPSPFSVLPAHVTPKAFKVYATSRPKSLGLNYDTGDQFSIDFTKQEDKRLDRNPYKKPAISFLPSSTARPSVGYHAVTVRPYGESHVALSEQYTRRKEQEKQKQVDLLDDSHFLTQQNTDIGKLPPLNKIPARSSSLSSQYDNGMFASPTERSVSLRSGLRRDYERAHDDRPMTDRALAKQRKRKQRKPGSDLISSVLPDAPSSFDIQRVRRPTATTRRPRTTAVKTSTEFEHFPSRYDTTFSSLKKTSPAAPSRTPKPFAVKKPSRTTVTRTPVIQPKPLLPIQDYFGRPTAPPARIRSEEKPFRKSEVDPFFLPRANPSPGRKREHEFPSKLSYQSSSDAARPTRSPVSLERAAVQEASSGFGFTSQFSAFPHFGSNLGGGVPDFNARMHPFTSSSFGSPGAAGAAVSQFLQRGRGA